MENTGFACKNIKIDVCVTSGAVLLTDWMDLDTLFVVQLREIARVLGSQGSPVKPGINTMRASIQGISSDFSCFSSVFIGFKDLFGIFQILKHS